MDRPTCKTCPFWQAIFNDDTAGECRIKAPLSKRSLNDFTFVHTHGDSWCGEHPDFPAFISATRKPTSRIPDDLPIKAGDSLYWNEFAKRYVHHPKTPPTAPPSSTPTPPCEPSERALMTAQADKPPE